ncbi:hypothetical protein GCM10020258_54360 [Sphingomonas yabuuchiae]
MGLVKGARLAAEEPWLPGAGAVLAATDWCDRGNGIRYDGCATDDPSSDRSRQLSELRGLVAGKRRGRVAGTPL